MQPCSQYTTGSVTVTLPRRSSVESRNPHSSSVVPVHPSQAPPSYVHRKPWRTSFQGPPSMAYLMLAAARRLLSGIAKPLELEAVLRGLPHNVTTIMDLNCGTWRCHLAGIRRQPRAGRWDHRSAAPKRSPIPLRRSSGSVAKTKRT